MKMIKKIAFLTVLSLFLSFSARAEQGTLEDIRDQGILYFKKGLFKQARSKLVSAYKKKAGKKDFRTIFYRAKTAYKLLLLEEAFDMANRANKFSGKSSKKQHKVKELLNEMGGLYGGVTFKAAKGETNKKGRIFFESKTGIINREKKKRFMSIRERFRSTDITLPTTIYLPYGEYLANKVPFSISQGEKKQEIEIFLQIIVDGPESNALWYVGIGTSTAVVAGIAAYFLFSNSDVKEISRIRVKTPQGQREN